MANFDVLAEHSYEELLNVLSWFSNFGLISVLIGGWAVFAYNSYFGSVDVDFVGQSMGGRFLDTIERCMHAAYISQTINSIAKEYDLMKIKEKTIGSVR